MTASEWCDVHRLMMPMPDVRGRVCWYCAHEAGVPLTWFAERNPYDCGFTDPLCAYVAHCQDAHGGRDQGRPVVPHRDGCPCCAADAAVPGGC